MKATGKTLNLRLKGPEKSRGRRKSDRRTHSRARSTGLKENFL